MNAVVVYYSRTGTTKSVAHAVAQKLGCETKEITDLKSRAGVMGYLTGGKDAVSKKLTQISEEKTKSEEYDLYILGTPVWGSNPCPAIRTFITQNKNKIKKVALFCTAGGKNTSNTLSEMELLVGSAPLATLSLQTTEVKKNLFSEKVDSFVKYLKTSEK